MISISLRPPSVCARRLVNEITERFIPLKEEILRYCLDYRKRQHRKGWEESLTRGVRWRERKCKQTRFIVCFYGFTLIEIFSLPTHTKAESVCSLYCLVHKNLFPHARSNKFTFHQHGSHRKRQNTEKN